MQFIESRKKLIDFIVDKCANISVASRTEDAENKSLLGVGRDTRRALGSLLVREGPVSPMERARISPLLRETICRRQTFVIVKTLKV